jgi:hypothetical protein
VRNTVIAAGAGAALLLAGCGSPQVSTGSGAVLSTAASTSAGVPTGSPTGGDPARRPSPPFGGATVPDAQLDYHAVPDGYPKLVWTEGDGSTLGLVGQEGGCGQVGAHLAAQNPDSVAVTLIEVQPAEQRPCTMDLRYKYLLLHLDQPLGKRTVAVTTQTEKK